MRAQVSAVIQQQIGPAEMRVLNEIAVRVHDIFPDWKLQHILMDIVYAHLDCPLRLVPFLAADTDDFVHDVLGINQNLNHDTLKLENCFVPRFAKGGE